MTITEQIKKFVEDKCKKPTSKYGYDPFPFHFVPVVRYARELAKKMKADQEIVELSAWLHDIGSIMDSRKDHHITGSKIAEKKLKELGYSEEKIERVKECILSHRGSKDIKPKSLEAQILIEADAMSAFNDVTGLFQCAFSYENLSRKVAKDSVRKKLENKWKQLRFKDSKKIIKPKYNAAMLLLK